MNETLPNPYLVPTVSVTCGGRYLGYGKAASYEAADSGALPTIAAGRVRRRVPTAALYELLGLPLPAPPG
jgi:hypothetical protein